MVLLILLLLLVYSRFVGLNWGLPYPMHPDERNMAVAIQGLSCDIRNCYNPHFFAYGQFPLYLGYLLIQVYHFISGKVGLPILFEEAVISLRLISAIASIINVFVLINIIKLLKSSRRLADKNQKIFILNYHFVFYILIFTFSPYFIQFSHFGTTEALLMLFYSLIIYHSLQYINRSKRETLLSLSLFSGLAMGTKVSAAIFMALPIIAILISNLKFKAQKSKIQSKIKKSKTIFFLVYLLHLIRDTFLFLLLTAFFSIVFSPHNLISFSEFFGSINYESAVALGEVKVFYTRQFDYTTPVLFQLVKIFPYALGWPMLIFSLLGLLLVNWPDKKTNLLRFAFLVYFLPNAFFYAKWTRFMAPVLPLMSIFAVLFLFNFQEKIFSLGKKILNKKNQKFCILICHFAFFILIFALIIPGIAYLSIYQNPDVRFTASKWIYENIPNNAYILFETANVVDVPIRLEGYKVDKVYREISFNYYDIDSNPLLKEAFYHHLAKADYIFVPSRRVFKNHYCDLKFQVPSASWWTRWQFLISNRQKKRCQYLKEKYPLLNDYYDKLFSGRLGFKKVAEFSSYPKITFFGRTLIEFPDENAEETWTVFDHPVIRIYKRV